MEFEYRLLTNRDSPLARREVRDLTELNSYIEVLHDDFQLPGEEGSSLRWQVNPNRRIHVYERCSQFSILQSLPTAYMWASPMPQRALEQYHLVLRKNARPSASVCGMCWSTRTRAGCGRKEKSLSSCCTAGGPDRKVRGRPVKNW